MKWNKIKAQEWLNDNASQYEIIEWAGNSRDNSVFFNKNGKNKFHCSFCYLKLKIKKGKEVGNLIVSKENAQKWLDENAPHIKILKWSGRASKISEFIDENRNIKFKYNFRFLKYELKNNPYYSPGSSIEEQVKNRKKSMLKTYGVECNLSLEKTKRKIKQTNLKKYGVEYPQQNKIIKNKIKQTNLKKYGYKTPAENKQVAKKILQTKAEKGNCVIIDGKTLREWSKNEDLASYTTMLKVYKQNIDPLKAKPRRSILELKVKQFLDDNNIKYVHDKKLFGCNKRPDFLLSEFSLIIECDGEYYHQDKEKDKERNNLYKKLGYDILCFSGQEIENNWEEVEEKILKSIKI